MIVCKNAFRPQTHYQSHSSGVSAIYERLSSALDVESIFEAPQKSLIFL